MNLVMKKIFTVIYLLSTLGFVFSQTVKVTESDRKVSKVVRSGQAIMLELDVKLVEKLWKKEAKNFGKSSKDGKVTVFEAGIIPSISTHPLHVLTKVEGSGSHGTIVWMAVDTGSEWVTKSHSKYSKLEKILKDFGIKAYTTDINNDIKIAEFALNKASKDLSQIKKQGEKLAINLTQNADKKVMLENQLAENATQKVELENNIEQNIKDVEVGEIHVAKMLEALENQKLSLLNVK